ncbi:hypothetical protein, partial [Marinobacter sediminum]
ALTTGVLRLAGKPEDVPACVDGWLERHVGMIKRWKAMLAELKSVREPEYAMFSVALRELLDLAQSTMHSGQLEADSETESGSVNGTQAVAQSETANATT